MLGIGKVICDTCTVQEECRKYQQKTGSKEGMWGGSILKRK